MINQLFEQEELATVVSNRIIYTPSEFARASLFYLQEVGELDARKPHKSSRSNLESYLLFWVNSGAGSLFYNGKDFSLCPGDVAFIDCRNSYSHKTDADNLWTLKWIHFSGHTMRNVYDKYVERGGRVVYSPDNLDELDGIWLNIMTAAKSSEHIRDMVINQYLANLCTILMKESWHPEDRVVAKKKSSVIEIKEWIDINYAKKITLDQLSHDFYIDKYYLSKIFKREFGQNLSSYILSVRITKAKHLLRFTDKTIEEIGIECGLGSPNYFSSTFKSVEGVPPSRYREQW